MSEVPIYEKEQDTPIYTPKDLDSLWSSAFETLWDRGEFYPSNEWWDTLKKIDAFNNVRGKNMELENNIKDLRTQENDWFNDPTLQQKMNDNIRRNQDYMLSYWWDVDRNDVTRQRYDDWRNQYDLFDYLFNAPTYEDYLRQQWEFRGIHQNSSNKDYQFPKSDDLYSMQNEYKDNNDYYNKLYNDYANTLQQNWTKYTVDANDYINKERENIQNGIDYYQDLVNKYSASKGKESATDKKERLARLNTEKKNLSNEQKRMNQFEKTVYDYNHIDELSKQKNIKDVAKQVLNGNWGNGWARRKALEDAWYNYEEVQKEVNKLMRNR